MLKKLFLTSLLLLPVIYVYCGWYIGLNYCRKPLTFGPYPDIPVAVKTGLLGSSLEDISGSKAIMMVIPIRDAAVRNSKDMAYFKRTGYFELPGTWKIDFAYSGVKKTFVLTGSLSRAICHDLKDSKHNLGSLSVGELNDFLKLTGRTKDLDRLKPYLFLYNLEEKYPFLYSDTVLIPKAMGNVFNDNGLPYDVLGLAGIAVLFIALALRSFRLWVYYLYLVFSYWFARVGYHDPNLIFSKEGWQLIYWSFWHGFIVKEGRIFLVIALGISAITFGILGLTYLTKQVFYSIDKRLSI